MIKSRGKKMFLERRTIFEIQFLFINFELHLVPYEYKKLLTEKSLFYRLKEEAEEENYTLNNI